ncbi:MAG: XRE family transcriptional regulator [Neisseriales bacterium]|nr:MAG: XRE family transcriptional regulator [Neisseriales bacterium]
MNDYEKTLETLAKNIRKRRAELKISQDELAYLAGVHRAYIGSVERAEKNITIGSIYKIAKALNITINELIANN